MMDVYLRQLQDLYGLTPAAAAAAAAAATSTTKPPKVLDTRPQQQYLQQRLAYSVNVQLPSLTSNCYLLPDKSQPFAVIVPSASTFNITQEQSQHGTQQGNGSTAVFLKGTSSLQEFLTSRGWAAACFLQDCPELWQAAEQLQLLEQQPADLQQLAKRCLFAPSQLLEAEVEGLEAALAALRMREQEQIGQTGQLQEGSKQQQQQQQQQVSAHESCCSSKINCGSTSQQPGAGAVQVCLHALDVGCGSGRDVAWLASRQTAVQASSSSSSSCVTTTSKDGCQDAQKQQQQQQRAQQSVYVSWHVTGVDEWLGALERAADLAAAMQLSAQQVQLVLGSICPQSGSMQLQQLPAKSRLHRARHVSVLHAGSPCDAAAAAASSRPKQESTAETSTQDESPAAGAAAAPPPPADTAGASSTASTVLRQYDLILCVRFLERSLLPQLRCMLKPGGYILYCTFVNGPGLRAFGRPSGHDHVLQPGELASLFGPQHGFTVLRDEAVLSADGRELSWFAAQL
jgi:2-polyprenyl-3-methyl-5-hydroxy-6-metoxy-1,4-benzoquinol methylase